jgi:hypothetical protein
MSIISDVFSKGANFIGGGINNVAKFSSSYLTGMPAVGLEQMSGLKKGGIVLFAALNVLEKGFNVQRVLQASVMTSLYSSMNAGMQTGGIPGQSPQGNIFNGMAPLAMMSMMGMGGLGGGHHASGLFGR